MDMISEYELLNRDQDEQRLFNLYRYYLSQYPELFESKPATVAEETSLNPQVDLYSKYCDSADSFRVKTGKEWKHRSSAETKKRCFRCSKCCQSDSSIWSVSEPDLVNRDSEHPNRLEVNDLNEDERYAHLSRVITPPNAFLNRQPEDTRVWNTGYSNKVTQTDEPPTERYYRPRSTIHRQLSLVEPQIYPTRDFQRLSADSDHIYYSILEQQQYPSSEESKSTRPRSKEDKRSLFTSKVFDSKMMTTPHVEPPTNLNQTRSKMATFLDPDHQIDELDHHRIPTSKDGIPCSCNQCRESRGKNSVSVEFRSILFLKASIWQPNCFHWTHRFHCKLWTTWIHCSRIVPWQSWFAPFSNPSDLGLLLIVLKSIIVWKIVWIFVVVAIKFVC